MKTVDVPLKNDETAFHTIKVDDVFSAMSSSENGLSRTESSIRLQQYGENQLPLAAPRAAWKRFLSQFQNVFIYVLIASAIISALLMHFVDSGVIFVVVLVNAIVGFIQEGKAEDALRAIMTLAKTQCMVVRDGGTVSIDSSQLVPGDIVMLQAGDKVPADIRLFYNKDLSCDESALTGEAHTVEKQTEPLSANIPLAEISNMAFMGTMVTFGAGKGVVVKTGLKTEIGKVSELVGQVEWPETPLQKQLDRFARKLTVVIVIFASLAMALGILMYSYDAADMFQAAIGIAVSSIPEGLPAIVTISLAIGVQRMAKSCALVRRLPAVEVLGSVDVICSDKTGTLTANAMTAREVFTAQENYRVSGEGYKPEGIIEKISTKQQLLPGGNDCFTQCCEIALLCNDASLELLKDEWQMHGDPTEGALLTLAMKSGLTLEQSQTKWNRVDLLPFESERRYMATLHQSSETACRLMVKGAPERLLEFASTQLGEYGEESIDLNYWQNAMDNLAREGMRVMALAYRDLETRPDKLEADIVETSLVLAGFVGISDPPRPEVKESIRLCHRAGISVKMITGDNPVTAAAIGKELGLDTSKVMTGQDIDALDPAMLIEAVEQTDVFARTSPANKLQLVSALQENRHVVAMTGDGVNDAPALKKASIGVAMGKKGTDAAREAADFVLTDDNFSTIEHAIAEGRTVYDNIVKSIIFILPTSLAEALVIFAAIVIGVVLPITPAQVLWINMITTVTLALALAFERTESDIMDRPPRPFGQSLITRALLVRLALVGGLSAFIVFSLFNYYLSRGETIEAARTIAINALVMMEAVYLFNCRYLTRSIFRKGFLTGIRPSIIAIFGVLIIQLLFTYLPVSQIIFGLENIDVLDWLILMLSALPILFAVELEKGISNWLSKLNAQNSSQIRKNI